MYDDILLEADDKMEKAARAEIRTLPKSSATAATDCRSLRHCRRFVYN